MIVETSSGQYKVKFTYVPIEILQRLSVIREDRCYQVEELDREPVPGDLIRTYCLIECPKNMFFGYVTQYSGDRHNKKVARRLAFEKAVAKIEDKKVRARLWDAFRLRIKQP